ncbi:unnamed protein product [Mytilus coruscus]|uniref:Uncharacterized protein n=1 Tax=Mytilus coruscus TaxID=42192 RepID=A0A6J8DQ08_MYTCO|nr:unnamed protein product [Mytilus coruscus]
MDKEILEHAMSFFLDHNFIQICSFGSKDLHFDNGDVINIPQVIRTTCYSALIHMYKTVAQKLILFLCQTVLFSQFCQLVQQQNDINVLPWHVMTSVNGQCIKGFSKISNTSFDGDEIIAWQAYNIGKGNTIKRGSSLKSEQNETGLKLVSDFQEPHQMTGNITMKE